MFEQKVQEGYVESSLEMAKNPIFWENQRISYRQMKYDSEYLYGLLTNHNKDQSYHHETQAH